MNETGTPKVNLANEQGDTIVPLYVEEARVSKTQIETGKIRVSTVTRSHEQVVEELLARERVEVERKPINKRVDTMPVVREEGDTVIVPVVEEILVIERKLLLKEELHIKRVRSTEQFSEKVILRKQEAVIEREGTESVRASGGSLTEIDSLGNKSNKEI